MMTLQDILPKLKRHERVAFSHETPGTYFRFIIEFKRFQFLKRKIEFEIFMDSSWITIKYFHEPTTKPLPKSVQDFLARLEKAILLHPNIRLRAVTGGVKTRIVGVEESLDNEYVDVHEMTSFFVGLILGCASLFEIFSWFQLAGVGFLVLSALTFGILLYAGGSVWLEDRKDLKDKSFWLFALAAFLFIIVLTLLLSAGLFLSLCVSWIFPWWATFSAFGAVCFGYHWIVKAVRKVMDMNKKYSAGA